MFPGTGRASAQVAQTGELEETVRGSRRGRKGKGQIFEEEEPLDDSTAQPRYSTQIIYRRAWAPTLFTVLFYLRAHGRG